MKRTIDSALLNWKNDPDRKVLLLRGARQIGKTYSIRNLGKSFEYFLEVNFEEEKNIKNIFQDSLNPQLIIQKLAAYFAIPIIPAKTLLFFDEIQSCKEALSSLRFFYEKMPDLHVIAAGSLLEFALSEIPSQGVGRITSLFMYPMSLTEFLLEQNEDLLLEEVYKANSQKPIDTLLHKKLIEQYKIYQIIGGMPDIVQSYITHRNLLICQKKLDDLLLTLKDDFAKYKNKAPVSCLNEVFNSIVFQTGQKFKYSNIDSHSSFQVLKEALELLIKAGLAYKVIHSSAQGIPLGAQINHKKFKVILFDIGLHQRLLGLDLAHYLISDEFSMINKGSLAEAFVGLELIKYAPNHLNPQLFYWHREAKNSNAEIDYLIQKQEHLIPIEVKAGTKGQMQSMLLFFKTHSYIKKGIRVSLENFNTYDQIDIFPLYAIRNIIEIMKNQK